MPPATRSGLPPSNPAPPTTFPLASPGGAPSAAREHVLPALYPAAATGLPTLADKGYTGAGIGIHVPTKGADLARDNRCRNQLLNASRAPAERANALLKSSFKALRRITLCPQRIGHIVTAALVLLTINGGRW